MFAITADQVGSRAAADLADAQLVRIEQLAAGRLVLPADRTAGDEIQAATEDARAALELVLDLTRDGNWSVGLGVGDVRHPLPDATRAATGSAFILARDAVARAKKSATRFAIAVDTGRLPDAALLQETLAGFRRDGARAVAIEVSSIGLEQGRVDGTKFDVALFTNLSRDHLDHHGTMAAYLAANPEASARYPDPVGD